MCMIICWKLVVSYRYSTLAAETDANNAAEIEDKEKKALAMRLAIRELPQSHQDCLEFLIFHLARVMAHDKENLVSLSSTFRHQRESTRY